MGRDEIQQGALGWGTFVEFDGCVNFCVRVLRKALADDARRPASSRRCAGAAIASSRPSACVAAGGRDTAL